MKKKKNTAFPELRKRSRKAGKPPGTLVYTGEKKTEVPRIMVINYDATDIQEKTSTKFDKELFVRKESGVLWVHVEGLHDVELIKKIAEHFHLHPLTMEDILNIEQRSKVEEFNSYLFITLKTLSWSEQQHKFMDEEVSIVIGEGFVLSFQESESKLFTLVKERLRSGQGKRMREHGADYLAYRLLDTIVDQYFVVLEKIGDQIQDVEEMIIAAPEPQHTQILYRLKREILILRKTIWPVREAISHLLQVDSDLVTSFTLVYLRDVYDHVVQAIDTVESFRDMIAGLLDVYMSITTNQMSEIMKVLTVISTIFLPIGFITGIYGMNFTNMPELQWRYSYPTVLAIMAIITIAMLVYFKKKKWF